MKKNRKLNSILFIIVFVLLTLGMGIKSFFNLMTFYIEDKLDYNEWTSDLGNKFETDIATAFFEKFQFVNLNGAIRNLLGQHEMNGVVKLNNGYLLTTNPKYSSEQLLNAANNVAAFSDYLESRGTSVVYAVTPYTSSPYDPQLPAGVQDYGNDNIDRMIVLLDYAGVDTIDFRTEMYEDGINQYDMMYKTDHHWTTMAGFYAYKILEDYITEQTKCNVDERVSNIDNYTVTTYKNWHLGSRGQRTGRYFAGIDDFQLIIPKFKTLIQNDAGIIGSMQDLVINMAPLKNREYTSRYTYDNVLGKALGHYVNLDCKNDIKILLITDSFGKSVAPYLMMGFGEIDYIYDADISAVSAVTPEYIESCDLDVVILMYYAGCFSDNMAAYSFCGY